MSDTFAENVALAIRNGAVLPHFEKELSLEAAYKLQHKVTSFRSPESIGGIKAGVTASAAQAFFGLEQALIASLYSDSFVDSGSTLPYVEGRLIESELALKIDSNGEPVAIAPAFEIVAVRFAESEQLTAPNLVACNLGADLYVVGDFVPWDDQYNDLSMSLSRGDETLNETSLSEALNGPKEGAKWIFHEAKARDFELRDDLIFMMGACGAVVPAEKGHYVGDYGNLGTVTLTIK